jgi:hypothetical protein
MATCGELTVGALKKYLEAYPDDTKVVLGQKGTGEVLEDCWANSYYPPHLPCTTWVVIDSGFHWADMNKPVDLAPLSVHALAMN